MLKNPFKTARHSSACVCGDCHDHAHGDWQGFDKLMVLRLLAAAIFFAAGLILKLPGAWNFILILISALIAGYDIVIKAVVNTMNKQLFDECFLMTVAAAAAFIIGESHEGAAVLLLFQIGELFQDYAVGRTRQSIKQLMTRRHTHVTLLADGDERVTETDDVKVGDILLVHPGECFALDCVVTEGETSVDMSAIAGESEPRHIGVEDKVVSGAVNLGSAVKVEVTAAAGESTSEKILDMVESEGDKKGATEKFITRFAKIYTPIVIGIAVLVAIFAPIVTDVTFAEGVHRALVFLVLACPCAIVISVPLTYFAGIGGASREGVLFKNSSAVDAVSKAKAVVFDKTGTLTNGEFRVAAVKSDRMDAEMLLRIAAHAEAYSNHPIAKSIIAAYGGEIYIELIQSFKEFPGGVTVKVDGIEIALGSQRFIGSQGVDIASDGDAEQAVYMSIEGKYAGRIVLSDPVKEDAADAVRELAAVGCTHIAIMTGDSAEASGRLAKTVGVGEYYSNCSAEDKASRVAEMKKRLGDRGTLIFVTNGKNDEAAMQSADVGVAMGGLSSGKAIDVSDVVIMDDKPSRVVTAINASRSTRMIAFQNIFFTLAIKLIIMVLGFFGISGMWLAVVGDVGVALAAVLNSMRAFYIRRPASFIKRK